MNKHILEGEWNQIKGSVKEKWGKLTDDEVERIDGKVDQLIGELQAKYGYSRDKAEEEVNAWAADLKS